MVSNIHDLKKLVFYELLDLAGRVFVLVKYSGDVIIGDRGFLPEEKEKGLVLVFNSRMNFEWNDSGISAKLVFGTAPQQCFVPVNSILSVFSPELSAQFLTAPEQQSAPQNKAAEPEMRKEKEPRRETRDSKVVEVDFKKKR
jgi:hypothetical protein